jgi:hypothetical protein
VPNTVDSPLKIPANNFSADEKQHRAVNKSVQEYANATYYGLVPTGGIVGYADTTPPAGWVECNGSALNRREYAALFSIIGTDFGVGDGSTTFNVPTYAQARAIFGGTAAAAGLGIMILRTGVY